MDLRSFFDGKKNIFRAENTLQYVLKNMTIAGIAIWY